MKKSKLGQFFGDMALGVIALGVMLFLGKHSLNFFTSSFKDGDVLFAWLGLLMTSGGVVGWLAVFMWKAETTTRKGIAIIMMVVAGLGEFMTAGFDMYMSSVTVNGAYEFLPSEIKMMSMAVAFLGLVTGLALAAYVAGDQIRAAFADDDGDGIPNAFDRHDNRKDKPQQPNPQRVYEQQIADLRAQLKAAQAPKEEAGNQNPPQTPHQ